MRHGWREPSGKAEQTDTDSRQPHRPTAAASAMARLSLTTRTNMDTQALIKQYTELRTAYDLEAAAMERQRAAIMAKVQDELDALTAEFGPRLTECSDKFTALEGEIKQAVKENGATLKGDRWQFVYAKGRTSWDTKALDGYAAAHPEISQFKSEGDPSVSVRAVK